VKIQSFNPRGRGPMSLKVEIMSAEERKYKHVPSCCMFSDLMFLQCMS